MFCVVRKRIVLNSRFDGYPLSLQSHQTLTMSFRACDQLQLASRMKFIYAAREGPIAFHAPVSVC